MCSSALAESGVGPDRISAVVCGTTHFVNALLTRKGLAKVGVLRLCLPSCQALPPFSDLPPGLPAALGGHYRLLPGGVEYNGAEISALDEAATREAAVALVAEGARSLLISQAFAPVRREQEDRAAEWVRDELAAHGHQVFFGPRPKWVPASADAVDVSTSTDVAGLGLLERENAAILNAALRPLARRAAGALLVLGAGAGLRCPVLLTQNDGSVAEVDAVAGLPIRCVQSGPVNSAVGALCLSGLRDCLFLDIGGTSTDVGHLVNGMPRPASRDAYIAKVRTNYEMPDVLSVPLGGGTIVAEDGTVGPASVGRALTSEALAFGGSTLTTTCVALALQKVAMECPRPDAAANRALQPVWDRIQQILADAIEAQRTSAAEVAVVVVGGGAFLCGSSIEGARVVVPRNAGCANAVGAACARVSGSVDLVESFAPERRDETMTRVRAMAVMAAEDAGAEPGSTEVVSLEEVPLAYMPDGATRLKAKAIGRFGRARAAVGAATAGWSPGMLEAGAAAELPAEGPAEAAARSGGPTEVPDAPRVRDALWQVAGSDIDALALGVGILGCGGGGSPYSAAVRLKALLAQGRPARIARLTDVPDSLICPCGYMGAPTVSAEVLPSSELATAAKALAADSVSFMGFEVGGGNGLEALVLAAQTGGIAVDADLMGRAFPELQMQTASMAGLPVVPAALADKHGNVVVVRQAATPKQVEAFLRPVCGEMGCWAGLLLRPLSPAECSHVAIPGTLSRAWSLGRAVLRARCEHRDPAAAVLEAYGGGRLLFVGKVVDVQRETAGGFARGFIRLRGQGELHLDVQNEFLIARQGRQVLGSVPDLLCLLETATGRPVATEEVRYGLRASLLALPAPPQLRTEAALRAVGPSAFGYRDVPYCPVGDYSPPDMIP